MANERRLVDANVLVAKLGLLARHEDGFRRSVILGVIETIKKSPTVDAVEVCYCKDCKHYALWADGRAMNHCDKHDRTAYDDDFCSYGERKEE